MQIVLLFTDSLSWGILFEYLIQEFSTVHVITKTYMKFLGTHTERRIQYLYIPASE